MCSSYIILYHPVVNKFKHQMNKEKIFSSSIFDYWLFFVPLIFMYFFLSFLQWTVKFSWRDGLKGNFRVCGRWRKQWISKNNDVDFFLLYFRFATSFNLNDPISASTILMCYSIKLIDEEIQRFEGWVFVVVVVVLFECLLGHNILLFWSFL